MLKKYFKMLGEFTFATAVCTLVALSCYLLLGQILEITGDSMFPTLHNKQHVLAEKLSPKFTDFRRGEIIVFKSVNEPNALIIKRIIGLPNDKIKIANGMIYINDSALKEPYLTSSTFTSTGPAFNADQNYLIPQGEYAVLGDNRSRSIDSREWGFLHKESILGRALVVYKPLTEFKLLFW